MAIDLKVNVEGRFDYINANVNHEAVSSTNDYKEKTSGIKSNVLRLNALATINDNLSFRMRYRFSTAQNDTKPNRDLTWNNVDLFHLDHKTTWFTARLGKHNNPELIGREFFMPGSDYPVTMASNSTLNAFNGGNFVYSSNNSAVYNSVNADLGIYRTGGSLIFKQIEGHTFTINISEAMKTIANQDTSSAANDSTNTSMAYGIYYNGVFANKLIQPTFGYTLATLDPESDKGAQNTTSSTFKVLAVGLKSEVAGFAVDVDWKDYRRPNFGLTTSPSNEDHTTSIWTNIAYTWDNLTPFVNIIKDDYDVASTTTTDYKRTALSAGLMIKPFKELNFRYHVAFTNDVKKIDGASTATADKKITSNLFVAGIKFDI